MTRITVWSTAEGEFSAVLENENSCLLQYWQQHHLPQIPPMRQIIENQVTLKKTSPGLMSACLRHEDREAIVDNLNAAAYSAVAVCKP